MNERRSISRIGHDDQGAAGRARADPSMRKPSAAAAAGQQQPPARVALALERGDERRPDRQRDEERQRQIGQRHPRQREIAEAEVAVIAPASSPTLSSYQRRPHAAVTSTSPTPASADQRRAENSVGPGHREDGRGQPVVEDRLLEARLVVEVRRQPVARLDHLARRLGVERLVGVGDGAAAQPGEERRARPAGPQESSNGARATIVAVAGPKPVSATRPSADGRSLNRCVRCRMKTVAVIGASPDRRKFGNKALRAFREAGYRVDPDHAAPSRWSRARRRTRRCSTTPARSTWRRCTCRRTSGRRSSKRSAQKGIARGLVQSRRRCPMR